MNRLVSTLTRTLVSATALTALGSVANAQELVEVPGPDGVMLDAVRYLPAGHSADAEVPYPAVVMLHGCSGIWSNRVPFAENADGTPNLQNHIEKWGLELAAQGYVALAVDSYTAREPAAVDPTVLAQRQAWQNQCSEKVNNVETNANAGQVNPYTTRVLDARAAYDYLVDADNELNVAPASVGLLGWSQGAQTAMVEAAATPRDSNTARAANTLRFAHAVVYYPGCGTALGFGTSISFGYWRPYANFRMNMGELDGFSGSCEVRTTRATNLLAPLGAAAPDVDYVEYDEADHSFDAVSQDWPTDVCVAPAEGDVCAMNDADISSLQFFDDNL